MIIKRESRTGANDLQTIYRPCRIDEMVGHETNKNVIRGNLDSSKVPHSYLFTGPAGCGKTTAARIIALGLNCENADKASYPCLECNSCKSILNHNSMDVQERNIGAYGNKDDVLRVIEDLPMAPFSSKYKIVILDEAHKLTSASQDALLKIIEDGYDHVYFILCTNEPEKLKGALIDRCNIMHFGKIAIDLVCEMLKNVAEFEGMEYKQEVLQYIATESTGVPRRSLVWLKQVSDEGSWTIEAAKEITGIFVDEDSAEVIELCRALLSGEWKKSITTYANLKKLPPESVRVAIEGYFTGCLKRARSYGDGRRFSKILDAISAPIYATGKTAENRFYNYMFKVIDIINTK